MNQLFTRHIQYNYSPKHTHQNNTDVLAIGFEPPKDASTELGCIYLCFESDLGDQRINTKHIIQSCGEAFYGHGIETSLEDRFKLCLRALNELIATSQTACNIAIIATHETELLFANIGEVGMKHLRAGQITDLQNKPTASTFSEIGSGRLIVGDKIFLASKVMTKSLTDRAISKLLSNHTLDDLQEVICDQIKSTKPSSACFIVVATEAPRNNPKKTTPQTKKHIKQTTLIPKTPKSLKQLGDSTRHQGKKIRASIHKTIKSTSKKVIPGVSTKTKQGWTFFWTKYINPNPKQAIIVVIITILILISSIWGYNTFFNTTSLPDMKKFNEAIVLIENAQNKLKQNNTSDAKSLAKSAQQLLTSVGRPQQDQLNSLAQQNKIKVSYSDALVKIQGILDKASNTIRLNTSHSFQIPQAQLSGLIWTNNNLLGLDPSNGSVVEINPLLGSPIERGNNPDLIGSSGIRELNGGGLIMLGKTGVWQYTPSMGLQQLKVPNLPQSVDIASYLQNIYLLSPSSTQVIRYAKSGTNLITQTPLLKNLSNGGLEKATSLIVNGNIFIAQNTTINLFESGNERLYELSGMPKDFGEFTRLSYYQEQGYFLLQNKSKTRLALLSAEPDSANFIRQYAMPNDAIIQAYTIEPSKSQLILFSDGKITVHKIEK